MGSHQTTIFESTQLHCTIMCTCIPTSRSLPLTVNVRQWRRRYLGTKSGYSDRLHDAHTYGGDTVQQSSLTMRKRILWSDTRCPPTMSVITNHNDCVCYIKQDALFLIDTTEVDPGRANTISGNSVTNTYDATNADGRPAYLQRLNLCWAWWLSEALQLLHQTPNTNSRVLPVVNYQATRKRAKLQLILQYYVYRKPFSISRWQSGVPMNSTGGPKIPRLLDLETVYTS